MRNLKSFVTKKATISTICFTLLMIPETGISFFESFGFKMPKPTLVNETDVKLKKAYESLDPMIALFMDLQQCSDTEIEREFEVTIKEISRSLNPSDLDLTKLIKKMRTIRTSYCELNVSVPTRGSRPDFTSKKEASRACLHWKAFLNQSIPFKKGDFPNLSDKRIKKETDLIFAQLNSFGSVYKNHVSEKCSPYLPKPPARTSTVAPQTSPAQTFAEAQTP